MPFSMPPGLRIPYDSDGTVVLVKESVLVGNEVLDVHPDAVRALNGDRGIGVRVDNVFSTDFRDTDAYFGFVFPVPTRIRGIFFLHTPIAGNTGVIDAGSVRAEGSKNSTNTVDGDWEFIANIFQGNAARTQDGYGLADGWVDLLTGIPPGNTFTTSDAKDPAPYYRQLYNEVGRGINEVSGSMVRNLTSLRLKVTGIEDPDGVWVIHLYGEPDTEAAGENYLQAWRSDSDMRLGGATLSWGDVPLASSADKTFRIKNQSPLLTANDIDLSVTDTWKYPSPSTVATQFLLSLDGTTWTPTLTLGALGPDTVSPTIYVRRVTPADAPLGSWSPKLLFDVGSWS